MLSPGNDELADCGWSLPRSTTLFSTGDLDLDRDFRDCLLRERERRGEAVLAPCILASDPVPDDIAPSPA